ncbi:MAG: RloB family protein [Clostridiales Family XIII bacterium]|jgi:hypothetical protein|nr:RloB family protein [Clostridiales Family XIII bacterium]
MAAHIVDMNHPAIRVILICCEGKTEKQYFEMIADIFRVHTIKTIEIMGGRGQHRPLIDRTVDEREILAGKLDIGQNEISAWAVCDEDKMSCSFHELSQYAEARSVALAFSRPQFEAYLLQHFEQSKETRADKLYVKLSKRGAQFGLAGDYQDNKANLSWLNRAIFNDPHLVDIAIVNSDLRQKQSGNLFLTVQRLTEFLVSLEPK